MSKQKPIMKHILKLSKVFSLALLALLLAFIPSYAQTSATAFKDAIKAFNQKDYKTALELLDTAQKESKLIADYIIFYKARAYQALADNQLALQHYSELISSYPDSALVKKARFNSIDLHANNADKLNAYEQYLRSYPDDLTAKYRYALLLKDTSHTAQANKIFKELYINASTYAKESANYIDTTSLSADELLRRCENLKKMWHFETAEDCFRQALKKKLSPKNAFTAKEGLAYSLFRQKRYAESAELYKELNLTYWRARSLFRASDMQTFAKEYYTYKKSSDKRISSVLVSYATSKRRLGNLSDAIKIYDELLGAFSSATEEILWSKAWSYYITSNYPEAKEILLQLAKNYPNSKYHYWLKKIDSKASNSDNTSFVEHRDYYSYLHVILEQRAVPAVRKDELKVTVSHVAAQRAKILDFAGLRQEASNELVSLSKRSLDENIQIFVSLQLQELAFYKNSVNIILKQPYRPVLHPLFYPQAFQDEVHQASKATGLDANLLLAIIREESRFDPQARSIAGALGLMQLMPQTARRIHSHTKVALTSDADLLKPEVNIQIGAHYFKWLVNRFGSIPVAIAAYNAGEDVVSKWLKNGKYSSVDAFIEDIPYDETRNYVKRVLTTYFEYCRYYLGSIPPNILQFASH